MKTVEAYQTTDGLLFTDEHKAKKHQEDLIGQEIDAFMLFATSVLGGDITRNQQYRICMHLLNNKIETAKLCENILKHIKAQPDQGE